MKKNGNYEDITIHIMRSTAKIWKEEAEKHDTTLEDFISKVLLWYKIEKDNN